MMADLLTIFNTARGLFPGTKRGLKTEFSDFKKKHKDWADCVELLEPAILREMNYKRMLRSQKVFCPEWPHFRTWLNQRRWEQEFPQIKKEKTAAGRRCPQCERYLDSTGRCFCGYSSEREF